MKKKSFSLLLLLSCMACVMFVLSACNNTQPAYCGTYYSGFPNDANCTKFVVEQDHINLAGTKYEYSYADGIIAFSTGASAVIAEENQVFYFPNMRMTFQGEIPVRNGCFDEILMLINEGQVKNSYNFYADGTFAFYDMTEKTCTTGAYSLKNGVMSLIDKRQTGANGNLNLNNLHFWYIDKNYSVYVGALVKDYKRFLTEVSDEPTYIVTWKNYDGTVLETDYNVAKGAIPTYNSETPTRQATGCYSYEFSGWSPDISAVSEDITYTAQFTEKLDIPGLSENNTPILEMPDYNFEGNGTEQSPYLIKTSAQLSGMGNFSKGYFELANDIILPLNSENRPNFEPLFSEENPFEGTFDGKGYKIENLYMHRDKVLGLSSSSGTGLFACIGYKGTIKNVRLENVNIFSTTEYTGALVGKTVRTSYSGMSGISDCFVSGKITWLQRGTVNNSVYIGGIAGDYINSISRCGSDAEIKAFGVQASCNVGGIAGYCQNSIYGSYNSGDITVECIEQKYGRANIGGVVGYFGSSVNNSCNTGDIAVQCIKEGHNDINVGGIGGMSDFYNYYNNTSIDNSYNTGNVAVECIGQEDSFADVGGIVGCYRGPIKNSYNTGEIAVECSKCDKLIYIRVGGLAGDGKTVERSYNNGDISVNGSSKSLVGGLIGNTLGESGNISYCYNTGNIAVNGPSWTGGLLGCSASGRNETHIENSYNIGNIEIKSNDKIIGGIAGYGNIEMTNCHWLKNNTVDADNAVGNYYGYNQNYSWPANIGATKHTDIADFYTLAQKLNEGCDIPVWENKTETSIPTLIKTEI